MEKMNQLKVLPEWHLLRKGEKIKKGDKFDCCVYWLDCNSTIGDEVGASIATISIGRFIRKTKRIGNIRTRQ